MNISDIFNSNHLALLVPELAISTLSNDMNNNQQNSSKLSEDVINYLFNYCEDQELEAVGHNLNQSPIQLS